MNTAEIAAEFTAMLKEGKHAEAAEKFNARDIVSIEAAEGPMSRVEGMEAVAAKGKWWMENHTVHNVEVEGPFVSGDRFLVEFDMDVTPKDTGVRQEMEEIALYTVKNGKIVSEEFFPEHGDEADDEDESAEAQSDDDEPGVRRQG